MRVAFVAVVFGASLAFTPLASVQAQTHSEFQSLVEQLQSNPSDSALRERLITMARELKPAPAIPEEAQRHFVQGKTLAEAATDAAGQKLAVESFQEALKIAPWWGDAWYNLGVVQGLAGQFADARASLQTYLLTAPGESERREAQNRIYALEAKEKLAAVEASNAAAQRAAKEAADREALLRSLNGARFVYENVGRLQDGANLTDVLQSIYTMDVNGRTVRLVFSKRFPPPREDDPAETCELVGLSCVLTEQEMCCGIGTCRWTITIEPTGEKATRDAWCTGGKNLEQVVLRRQY